MTRGVSQGSILGPTYIQAIAIAIAIYHTTTAHLPGPLIQGMKDSEPERLIRPGSVVPLLLSAIYSSMDDHSPTTN